jgi:hypothetical protein
VILQIQDNSNELEEEGGDDFVEIDDMLLDELDLEELDLEHLVREEPRLDDKPPQPPERQDRH